MSWSRRHLLLLLLAPLGGCGFHPLYGEPSAVGHDTALAAVRVQRIPNRLGQLLAQSLRERFYGTGAPVEPRYDLAIGLVVSRYDTGIRRDASATRGEVQMIATYTITDLKTSRIVFNGSSRANSSFNILDDGYAATVAEQDAQERGVRDLSREIALRTALTLHHERAEK